MGNSCQGHYLNVLSHLTLRTLSLATLCIFAHHWQVATLLHSQTTLKISAKYLQLYYILTQH